MEIQWALVLFTLIAGLGAGLLIYVALAALLGTAAPKRRTLAIIALVLIVAGGLCSVAHLAQPSNIMAAAQNLGSFSGISLEMIFLGVTVVLGVIYAIVAKGDKAGAGEKAVGVLALLSALVFCYVTGSGYVIEARAAWNTPLLPLAYLGSDLAMGAVLYAALAKADAAKVRIVVLVSAIVGAVLVALYAFGSGVMSAGGSTLGIVAVVCAVAGAVFAVLYWRAGEGAAKWAWAACACFLLAALFLRLAMWAGGTGVMDAFGVGYPGNFTFE